uniref:pre-rRNA processing protein FTSJ3 n=1 Tax=Anabas testudineus TaxID=64144 RepID=A0A7N6B9P5_ANATE
MGKKLKVGKTRKDKFYHLAKETGYRSRSSFKLIQLNRKFQFLQKARALVDLCAAPGGWLQVASKFMPVSSLIIGVDLVPIKPIPNVVTLQEDITTEKCRQALRKELQTWKVDVVLNDGAPNVGANWQHDAFSQAHLTLMALKLACEFLTKGGTFVTKVFRSKDYQPLLWIFQQFFKKVQATKPQASRNESAEIFVICQGFVAPDKIDSKFFDPKHAFKEVEVQVKTVRELIPVKKPKAEGYTDGDLTLYHSFTVTAFLKAENPVDFLGKASAITFDNSDLESHSATSDEIKECCRDIKVLGQTTVLKRHEIIVYWFDKQYFGKCIIRKKRKLLKERRKQRERVELKMDLPGVSIADGNDSSLFSLSTMKKKKVLSDISKGDMQAADNLVEGEDDLLLSEGEDDEADKMSLASDLDEEDLEEVEQRQKELEKKAPKKKVQFTEEEEDEEQESGLLVELEGKDEKKERETSLWFSKVGLLHYPMFNGDQSYTWLFIDVITELISVPFLTCFSFAMQGIFSEIDLEGDAESELRQTDVLCSSGKKARILDAEGLALGCQIATSKKRARDMMDNSFHRFASSEESWEIPEWLLDDERKHRKKPVPVTKEMVEEYKQKWKEIDARPIKRVAEAKARKKRRMLKKMEQAKKKAEAVVNTVDISEREKMAQLKSIYKKAGLGKEKREITYVVAKKGAGRKVRRPQGVKGVFKVVDSRMKKDMRGVQRKEQQDKKKQIKDTNMNLTRDYL